MSSLSTTYSNYANDWWTPPGWLKWVERTIGYDYHDPCPAGWTDDQPSGLDVAWGPQVYVNHPGARNGAPLWWGKYIHEQQLALGTIEFAWCAFNCEQLRHLRPSPFHLPGWLVLPRERTAFIWGGVTDDKRTHGEPCNSPGNWAVWWTNMEPSTPPVESIIVRTGV